MESLALLVSLIVSVAFIGGPFSLLLVVLRKRSKRSNRKPNTLALRIYAVFVLVFAIPAVLVGGRLITLDIGMGGRLFGLIGIITGVLALVRLYKDL